MRPLKPEILDARSLQDLGLASIQIVHDIKNQLNGLKLYATFLRKRMESPERPADELEVISKLIAGIDRSAAELTILGRFGRPIELSKRPGVELNKILSLLEGRQTGGEKIQLEGDSTLLVGEFDVNALTEAFGSITKSAFSMRRNGGPLVIHQRLDEESSRPHALIEWRNLETSEDDVFRTLLGADAITLAYAVRIIEAHQGTAEQQAGMLRVSLPVQRRDGD